MWIVRAAIEPMVWAFTCDKSKTGKGLPSGFTHSEKDARKHKTYEVAVRAEIKLRKAKGLTHNQTETSGTQEAATMTTEELQDVLNNSDVADIVKQICDALENAESCETLADFESNMRELLTLAKSLATEIKTVRS
jgi:hypothetical protein